MIISVPENKKLQKGYSTINEALSFDVGDIFQEDIPEYDPTENSHSEKIFINRAILLLKNLKILHNYDIEYDNENIFVDIHDHLSLPNLRIELYLEKFPWFHFRTVDGDCNFSNCKLSNWEFFPTTIKGDCYANFNRIKDFNGVPNIEGDLFAEKQKTKCAYPLTLENYIKYKNGTLLENKVHILSIDEYGEIVDINENKNYATIKFNDGTLERFKLNDIDCLESFANLLNL